MEPQFIKVSLCTFLLHLCFFHSVSCGLAKTPVIKTHSGKVVGVIEKFDVGDAAFFYSIPYGKAPVGDLRFAKTQPAESLNDVLDVSEEGPYCYEPITSARYVRRKYSEDCLTLTIITPPKALQEPGSRPVIVDLGRDRTLDTNHGRSADNYVLAVRQDLILVRVNSRRNIFGFAFTMADDGLNGNYGLWDQNVAFHWIKDNIKNFGGDPNKITIFGNSGSGQLVASHLLSTYTRGLFENIIIQSGVFQTLNANERKRVDESTNIVIDRVGCKKAKSVLDCLRQKDSQELIDALPRRWAAFEPVPDLDYIPLTENEIAYDSSKPGAKPNINALLGYSQGEGSLQLSAIAPKIFSDQQLTSNNALSVIRMLFNETAVDRVAQMYLGDVNQPLSILKIQKGLTKLVNDIIITCPMVATADDMTKGKSTHKSITYSLDYSITIRPKGR